MQRSVQNAGEATGFLDTTIVSAVITAAVALVVLAINRVASHIAQQRDLRRQALEEWLSALAVWVDEHRDGSGDPSPIVRMERYQQLTNRQVLELRFKRKDRFAAWWMHEIALVILDPSVRAAQATLGMTADSALREAGEFLLQWHHGELKSRDFHIPYALLKEARSRGNKVVDIAAELQLSAFISPTRMTPSRERYIAKLLSDPESGRPLLDSVGDFVGRRNAIRGLRAMLFKVAVLRAGLVKFAARAGILKLKAMRGELRIARLKRRLAKLESKETPRER